MEENKIARHELAVHVIIYIKERVDEPCKVDTKMRVRKE